ncbi:MAG: M48 family metalloprotease [Acidobacteria bacterium]|nr:M48 family metalloprotease [Acidobacteriota bacterium]
MKAARSVVLLAIAAALGAGLYLASRGDGADRRDLQAVVTLGGDAVHDAIHPALDLTRMSDADEAALGVAIDREIRAHMTVGGDPRTMRYLRRVLRALTPGGTRGGIPFDIDLVRSPEVNAFAVAGGRLYVTEGMMAFARSEAELATVIGHEMSHVELRHCVARLQIETAARKASPALADLARIGYEIALLGFSEEQELAADRNGALLAARGGYDPWAAHGVYARFAAAEKGRNRKPSRNPAVEVAVMLPDAVRQYLATHPPADQRIESVRGALQADPALWRGEPRYVGRTNFDERVARLDEARVNEWIVREAAPD